MNKYTYAAHILDKGQLFSLYPSRSQKTGPTEYNVPTIHQFAHWETDADRFMRMENPCFHCHTLASTIIIKS